MRSKYVFLAVPVLCLIGLARTQQYYGHIYHGWDAQFYFSMSHSLLFDRDVDLTNNLRLTPSPEPFDPRQDGSWIAAPMHADGRIPSKYPLGMSLAETPFLFVASLLRRALAIVGWEVQGAVGYSAIEVWCVAIGLQLLFSFGLVILYRVVRDDFGSPAAVLGVTGCWMGTSLFYYSAVFPFMAHAASFALLSMILQSTRTLVLNGPTNRHLASLGLLIGITFLVRPQQVVVALFLLPILASVVSKHPRSRWLVGACVGTIASLVAVALQVAFNYYQFGALTLVGYSIGGEGFSWLSPQISFVLFSLSRGLVVFSPVVALAILAYFTFPRSIPIYVLPLLGNAIAQIYLIAAWSSPEQGDSFGARMWSDNAAVVGIGLAMLFNRSRPRARLFIIGATLLAICWTMYLLARYVGL